MTTTIIVASFFVLGVVLLWALRRVRMGTFRTGQTPDALSLEATLPLGPQKRLLSVRWKEMDLLIAETGASVELLSSTILQSTAYRRMPPPAELPISSSSTVATAERPLAQPNDCPKAAQWHDAATLCEEPLRFGDLLETTAENGPSDTAEVFHA